MKTYKVYNILIIVIFILAISIPLITLNITPGAISEAENRVLASFPDIKSTEGGLNKNFITEFEKWFNDRIGLRDKLVKSNTYLLYNIFNEITKKDTLVGKNEWLYYVTPEIIKDYQNKDLPTNSELSQWSSSLSKIDDYLKERNIPFVTMLNLDKKTIYPENYPDTIIKNGTVSRTDMFEKYILENTDIDFFTPKEALKAAKIKETVYSPRYDIGHWNNYGAFIGYLELMERVKKYFPEIKVLSWEDFDIQQYQRTFSLYNSISFSENDYQFTLKKGPTSYKTDGYLNNLNLSHGDLSVTYENTNKSLPKILILGDSYLYEFLTPHLAESFSELTFIYTDNLNNFQSYIDTFTPDIVVYENVERMFLSSMELLTNSRESFVNYSSLRDNDIVQSPSMWLDYANNQIVSSQEKINIDTNSKMINLNGWAIDSKAGQVAGDVYLKVGDKYYYGSYGLPRPSVSTSFNDSNLMNSGFSFNIKTEDLISVQEVSFIIISNDKTYQYTPVNFQLEFE